MVYTVGNTTTVTSATLPNLQCNTNYTIWVYVESGRNKPRNMSSPRMVSLPAKGMYKLYVNPFILFTIVNTVPLPAPPTPTEVTAEITNASSVGVTWQWSSSGPAPYCFNTTSVTYHPEGGDESSLQLSDPAATETTLTDLQCNTNYTITVAATAGEHRRESVTHVLLQGILNCVCVIVFT